MFCCTLLYVHSSIVIILMGKRELVALLNLSSWCLVMVERLFLAMLWGCLRFVIVVFPDHTHLLFIIIQYYEPELVQNLWQSHKLPTYEWSDLASLYEEANTRMELFVFIHTRNKGELSTIKLVSRVVNLGTTTKLCKRIFVPKPHPGHVVVVSRPKIG